MEKQTHREPMLYIVGNSKRGKEIKKIIENEWGGRSVNNFSYTENKIVYYINALGDVWTTSVEAAQKATNEGWMKEYELPEKEECRCEFKPFDKVVVRNPNMEWCADLFSHVVTYDNGNEHFAIIGGCHVKECLPYNEDTAGLIGTNDDFDYDKLK